MCSCARLRERAAVDVGVRGRDVPQLRHLAGPLPGRSGPHTARLTGVNHVERHLLPSGLVRSIFQLFPVTIRS